MTHTEDGAGASKPVPLRSHSNFAARTARDEAEQLDRHSSVFPSPSPNEETPLLNVEHQQRNPNSPHHVRPSEEEGRTFSSVRNWLPNTFRSRSQPARGGGGSVDVAKPRPGAFPRPVGGTRKLGTFAGVFVPTTLNVLSILMFLRFGFILGQAGLVGMLGMLVACYAINLLTTMSISAIATNGTVRGGGAYYLISRSLGPEFGGSIGIVFYLGMVFNTSLNAVGLIDCFIENFGVTDGTWANWMLQGFYWQYLWATIVLMLCTCICLLGSGIFARCSNGLLVILLVATLSIPFSALVVKPFSDREEGIRYTGLSLDTLRRNLMPEFTRGAAGSQIKDKESFQDLFGILFPATGGIFAGASMSGDLKHPSKAIPKGTLSGLALTFVSYTLVILAMAATITRPSLRANTNVIQLTNMSGALIMAGEFATSAFSVLMGVIGSAKLLQALARDNLIPGLSIFGQGTRKSDDPTYAILFTYIIAQLTMLSDINQIASIITMAYLMTYLTTNLACFLLKIGSAPNFRPSFHFFNWQTAATGAVASAATMFFVDGLYASGAFVLLITIFLLIHYTTPPKPWGDVSQSLIYHQVRKYLLRLRQEHVKFWRPQILLLVNDPRRQYKLIQFCNSLKKGGLFVLGHVIVSQDFAAAVPEVRRQQQAWTRYIDFSRIKAFVNIVISPAVEWGARNIVLGSGLGGMRPNIVVMGFYNLGELRQSSAVEVPSSQPSRPVSRGANHPATLQAVRAAAKRRSSDRLAGILPTDLNKAESAISIQSYVTIVEDLILRLQVNVAIAKGFPDLELPTPGPNRKQSFLNTLGFAYTGDEGPSKKYIDLWPIQMSAEIATSGEDFTKKNALTTNFDTYTLILQLGCILNTVPSWKRTYKLRVCVFVEYESDVDEERGRVETLLRNLRIQAEVKVFWLASGDLKMYNVITNGSRAEDDELARKDVDDALQDEKWWQDILRLKDPQNLTSREEVSQAEDLLNAVNNWPNASFQHGRRESQPKRFARLKKMLRRRKSSIGDLVAAGLTLGMHSQRLPAELVSGSESSSDGEDDDDDRRDNEGRGEDEEAVTTESEDNLADYDLDASSEENDTERPTTARRRAKSLGTVTMNIPFMNRSISLRKSPYKHEDEAQKQDRPTAASVTPLKPHQDAAVSDTALLGGRKPDTMTSGITASSPNLRAKVEPGDASKRPRPTRHQSIPKFTSGPTPRTAVAAEETAGPSIMFVDSPSPNTARKEDPLDAAGALRGTTPSHASAQPTLPARPQPQPPTGYPISSALPLSFNDLPCRAQHLILNELIRKNSEDTAVVFTTLPSPMEGVCESEAESVQFISDLEVLTLGLPPCLLVHSNSMTVTMNL